MNKVSMRKALEYLAVPVLATAMGACAYGDEPEVGQSAQALSTFGDFSLDGKADVLWHNTTTGESHVWSLNNAPNNNVRTSITTIDNFGDPGASAFQVAPWRPVGMDDFNQDGKTDILWHNDSTGVTQIWYMSGTSRIGRADVDANLDGGGANVVAPWRIAGTGDFNQDGWPDILWHNTTTGEPQIWYMHNSSRVSRYVLVPNDGGSVYVAAPWSIVAVNRFSSSSPWPSILWYNSSTGESQVWFMQNFYRTSRATVVAPGGSPLLIGPPWSIAGSNDYNLDGKTDILWHNSTTNQTQIWYMNNNVRTGTLNLALPSGGGDALQGVPWEIVRH